MCAQGGGGALDGLREAQTASTARTALVLGGAGFVGRNLCAALRAGGYRVVTVGRRPEHAPPRCLARRIDLARAAPAQLADLLAHERPAVVVNAAGAVWGASDDDLEEGNVKLVDNLIAAMTTRSSRARLIHLGSVYEYGAQPTDAPVREDSMPHPVTRYARTKLAGSRKVLAASAAGLDSVVLRLSTVVGPGAPPQSLFGSIARRLAAADIGDAPVPLELPALHGERDFVDVRDVADAVLKAASAPAATDVFNISRGELVRVHKAVDLLIEISGVAVTVTRMPASGPRRDAGIGSVPISNEAAQRRLGWEPRRNLADALGALWRHTSMPAPHLDTSAHHPH